MSSASVSVLSTRDAAGPVFIVRYRTPDEREPVSLYFFDRNRAWDYVQRIMEISVDA